MLGLQMQPRKRSRLDLSKLAAKSLHILVAFLGACNGCYLQDRAQRICPIIHLPNQIKCFKIHLNLLKSKSCDKYLFLKNLRIHFIFKKNAK